MADFNDKNIMDRVSAFRKQAGIDKELQMHISDENFGAIGWGQSPIHPLIQDTKLVYSKPEVTP